MPYDTEWSQEYLESDGKGTSHQGTKLGEYRAFAALARAQRQREVASYWQGLAEAEEKRLQWEIEQEKQDALFEQELDGHLEDESCTGCDNGCDQCLDPLMAGYAGCYHSDSEKCNCAEEYRLHQKWIESSDDNDCACGYCMQES